MVTVVVTMLLPSQGRWDWHLFVIARWLERLGVQECRMAYCLSRINFNLLCQTAVRTWVRNENPLVSYLLLSVSCQLAFQADRLTRQEYFHQLANQC